MSEYTATLQFSSNDAVPARCDLTAKDGVTTAITEAVTAVLGCDPFDLSPIAGTIDPDALEAIVRSGNGDCVVRFRYEGLHVRVDGSGRVSVAR